MIQVPPYFTLNETVDEETLALLKSVALGTNGTIYRHLNTAERTKEIDNPLYFSLRRNERVLGNITFCRRNREWYIRYFAFDGIFQSSGKAVKNNRKKNLIKSDIEQFFQDVLEGKSGEQVDRFYAYIDPRNDKSLNMALQFGFKRDRSIATQTFSRLHPSSKYELKEIPWKVAGEIIEREYSCYKFYHTDLTEKGPLHGLYKGEELLALAKITLAEWKIEQLPGRFGRKLVNWLPKIPGLRKLINPSNHAFIVPEAIYVKNDSPEYLNELFEALLVQYGRHLIIWWVDENDRLYKRTRSKLNWGILNRILGVNKVDLMVRSNSDGVSNDKTPAYICGIDFV